MKRISAILLSLFLASNIFAQNSLWTLSYGNEYREAQVCKYDYQDSYELVWTSDFAIYDKLAIGDIDNDDNNEMLAQLRQLK
jgi:hypothetical protein